MGIKGRKKKVGRFIRGIESDVSCYPLDYTGTARRYATCFDMMHIFLCIATRHRRKNIFYWGADKSLA